MTDDLRLRTARALGWQMATAEFWWDRRVCHEDHH